MLFRICDHKSAIVRKTGSWEKAVLDPGRGWGWILGGGSIPGGTMGGDGLGWIQEGTELDPVRGWAQSWEGMGRGDRAQP